MVCTLFLRLINPRCMREDYGSRSVCECVCVCLLPCYLLHTSFLYLKYRVVRLLTACMTLYCVDLAENAPFKGSGVIYWSPPPSLPDELLMDKRH